MYLGAFGLRTTLSPAGLPPRLLWHRMYLHRRMEMMDDSVVRIRIWYLIYEFGAALSTCNTQWCTRMQLDIFGLVYTSSVLAQRVLAQIRVSHFLCLQV